MQIGVTGIEQQVNNSYGSSCQTTYGSGKRSTHHSPAKRENKQLVKNDIYYGGDDTAPHGKPRNTVQTHGKQSNGYPQLKQQRWGEPNQIIHNHRRGRAAASHSRSAGDCRREYVSRRFSISQPTPGFLFSRRTPCGESCRRRRYEV